MIDTKIKDELIRIIGEDAFRSGDMKPSEEVSLLSKAVNYLATQIIVTCNFEDDDNRRSHVAAVIENTEYTKS